GMWHRWWRGMDQRERREEFVAARDRLATVAGAPVDAAACPRGQYDRRVLTDLRRQGYTRVYTSDRRPARAGSWLQPRFSVRRDDEPATLRAEALSPVPLARHAVYLGDRLPPSVAVAGPRGARARLALDKREQVDLATKADLLVPPTALAGTEPPPGGGPWMVKPALATVDSGDRLSRPAG